MKPAERLWPHQERALRVAEEAHRQKRSRILLQFPPGAGKTETAARIVIRWLATRPFSRAVVAVPTVSILHQFRRRLGAESRVPIAIEQAEHHAPMNARLVIGTQNSLWGRLRSYGRDVLLISDEGHHDNLDAPENLKIARAFDHLVLLTATPWSSGCRELFGRPTVFLSLDDALKLRDASGRGVVSPFALCDWIEPRGPWGLVFCPDNDTCRSWSRTPPGSTFVTYDLGQDVVQARIAAWRAARHPVLYANLIPREGVDEPRCGEVWIAKETESDILNAQMAGRALRWQPGKLARIYCRTEGIRRRVARALERCNEEGA